MLSTFLKTCFLNNYISAYLFSVSVFIIGILVVRVFGSIILSRIKKWAKKTKTTLDDLVIHVIERSLIPLIYFGIFYLSIQNKLSI